MYAQAHMKLILLIHTADGCLGNLCRIPTPLALIIKDQIEQLTCPTAIMPFRGVLIS